MLPQKVTQLTDNWVKVFDTEYALVYEFRGCRNKAFRTYKGGIQFQQGAFMEICECAIAYVNRRAQYIWEKLQEAIVSTGIAFYDELSADLQSQLASYMKDTLTKVEEFIKVTQNETQMASGGVIWVMRDVTIILPKLNAAIEMFCSKYSMNEKQNKESQGPTNIYHVQGNNARVNVNSTDNSVNITNVSETKLFADMRQKISQEVSDGPSRDALLNKVEELEKEVGKPSFFQRYKEFMALAANHVETLAPFMPALSQLLTN